MNWTTTKPVTDGFYWFRKNQYKNEFIVYVFFDHAESIANEQKDNPNFSRYEPITKVQPKNRVMYVRFSGASPSDRASLDSINGEWYGPLTPPE
jgi:hypothetical protein